MLNDSNTNWLGNIPAEWSIGRIGQLYSERRVKVSDTEYMPLSVTMKGVVPQLSTAAKTDAHDDRKLVRKGDFAINSRSDRRGSCGISEYDGSVSLINTILAPRKSMSPRYYNWLFHTSEFAAEFYKWGHGIVDDLWTTNWNDMKRILVPVPSLLEQERIADFVDRKCADIDNILEKTRASIEEYRKLKQSVITEAVTKGIRGERPMKDSGIEWIGEIPEEWTVIKFGYCAHIKSNLVDPSLYPDYPQIAPDVIGKGNAKIEGEITSVKESGIISWNHLFSKGQIIYSKIRPLLNKLIIAPFDGLCSADMYPIESDLDISFTKYMMLSSYFLEQVKQVTEDRVKMPKVNQEELSAFKVVIPPCKSEQVAIASYLDQKCSEIDSLIASKEKFITELELYKKSLIYEYVTGKKEVPSNA